MLGKRDNNKGPAVVKDLSQLGSLLKENKKPATLVSVAPKAPTTNAIQLDPEGDTLQNIWLVMADHKGRTVSEIERVFDMQLVPTEDVCTMLKLLQNTGYFVATGRPENPIYSMKKGVAMPNNSEKENQGFRHYKQRVSSAPVSQYDPTARIDPAEGLDCTLWKLTRDRKNRTLDEIGELARTFGFAPNIVRDRVILLANKHWYDRLGSGRQTKYALKKNISMPKPENVQTNLPESEIKVNSTTTFHSRNEKDYQNKIHNQPVPSVSQSNPVKEETMQAQAQSTAQQVQPSIQFSADEDLVVRKGDSWDLAIWKMMRDYKEYTAQDVALLLVDLGFNAKSTQVRISKLHLDHNWFEREKLEGSRSFKYRLKRDVARPVDANAETKVDAKTKEAQQTELPNLQSQQQPTQETKPAAPQATEASTVKTPTLAPLGATLKGALTDLLTADEKVIDQMSATPEGRGVMADVVNTAAKTAGTPTAAIAANAALEAGIINTPAKQDEKETMTQIDTQAAPEVKPAPPTLAGGKYLKFVVQVKDISLTIEEARKLHANLTSHGFGTKRTVPTNDTNNNLFSATYRIKGKDFAASAVQEIAVELESFGFGDDANFTE